MNCVILQPSYIPWRGYFHQIWKADCFIFYDDVQYDTRGWRNRNQIKTPQGVKWLTIPVYKKGARSEGTLIKDVRICPDTRWQDKHRHALEHSYSKAPFFSAYMPLLESFYEAQWEFLSDLTIEMTMALASELGIPRKRFLRSSTLQAKGNKTDRLLNLLKIVGATHYITGPSAWSYLEEEKLWDAGISLEYMNYDYSEYTQLYPPYVGEVSVLDLLFMTGPAAMEYILTPSGPERPATGGNRSAQVMEVR
jgi:WbqC-like protein family